MSMGTYKFTIRYPWCHPINWRPMIDPLLGDRTRTWSWPVLTLVAALRAPLDEAGTAVIIHFPSSRRRLRITLFAQYPFRRMVFAAHFELFVIPFGPILCRHAVLCVQ